MRRVVAAIAIVAGWGSIAVGGAAGVVVSQGFGANWTEGPLPPTDVYGLKGIYVLWLFASAAILTAQPLAITMLAPHPRRRLLITAAALGIPALLLLPSELGRVFGIPVIVGAGALVLAAALLEEATPDAIAGSDLVAVGVAVELPTVPESAATAAVATSATTPSRRAASKKAGAPTTCTWCSAPVPARATTCPSCGAALDSGRAENSAPIPGITEVPAELRAYKLGAKPKKPSILSLVFKDESMPATTDVPEPSDLAAILPPSAELRAEMARLDAEIASGQAIYGKDVDAQAGATADAGRDVAPEAAAKPTPKPEV